MKKQTLTLCTLLFLAVSCCKNVAHDGFNSLVEFQNFSGNANCPAGGLILKTGLDRNRNNILDSAEVTNTNVLCNGQNTMTDKQIFLSINFSANSTSTTPVIGGELIKFSKNNYPGVDSIIFVANPYVSDVANTSNVELYNLTDNVPINNSKITTGNLYGYRSFLQTQNVFNQLPDKEITLGIRFSSGNAGMFAAVGSAYLILYRR